MTEDQWIYYNECFYAFLSSVALPLFWTESAIFQMLGLPDSTSFRMFPSANVLPDAAYRTDVAHSYALITTMLIPWFVSRDRDYRRSTLGSLLRPLTRDAGPFVEYPVMFARAWLAVSWVNSGAVHCALNYTFWSLVVAAMKLSSVISIL